MLGHKLMQQFSGRFQVFGTIRGEMGPPALDGLQLIPRVSAQDFGSVQNAVKTVQPEVVINCIGLIKQIKSSRLDQLMINSVFPQQLADFGRSCGYRLIHISTDCVFSGKRGNYTEQDSPDPEDDYGRTKLLGEVDEPHLTLRCSIIGRELSGGHGLIEWFYSQAGGSIKGYKRAIYTGFTTLEMSRVIARVIQQHPGLAGLWQVSSEPIDKYALLKLVNEQARLGVTIHPDTQFVCDRSLDSTRFQHETGYRPPSWSSMVAEMLGETLPVA